MDRVKGTLSSIGSLKGSLSTENTITAALTLKVVETVSHQIYDGDTVIIPSTSDIILETADKVVKDDILVKEIPTYETSNEYGVSFIIAS